MQQFVVPQFIDVEDKIFGPITTRQFVIMLATMLLTFISYRLLAFAYFVFAAVLIVGLGAVLAFVKINGRPVHIVLLNFIMTVKRPKMRFWNRAAFAHVAKKTKSKIKETKPKLKRKRSVSGSRLKDLTLVVNTGGLYTSDEIDNPS